MLERSMFDPLLRREERHPVVRAFGLRRARRVPLEGALFDQIRWTAYGKPPVSVTNESAQNSQASPSSSLNAVKRSQERWFWSKPTYPSSVGLYWFG